MSKTARLNNESNSANNEHKLSSLCGSRPRIRPESDPILPVPPHVIDIRPYSRFEFVSDKHQERQLEVHPRSMSAYVLKHTLSDAHSSTINTVAFAPTGLYLASGADDNTIIVWNVSDGRFIFRLKFDSPVHAILWHPNRLETLIVGCRDGGLFQASSFRLVSGANPG